MRAFILNKLDKVKKYAQTDIQKDKLTQSPWTLFDPEADVKTTYFFKEDARLIISVGGNVEIGKWEVLSAKDLLISHSNRHFLLKHSYFLDDVLLLQAEGNEGLVAFINEERTKHLIESLNDLNEHLEHKAQKLYDIESPNRHASPLVSGSLTQENIMSYVKLLNEEKGFDWVYGNHTRFNFESLDHLTFGLVKKTNSESYIVYDKNYLENFKFVTFEKAVLYAYNAERAYENY
jgi:hypothetical protein